MPESDEDTWKERQQQEAHLSSMLKESPSNVILVTGSNGSGKSTLIAKALKDTKYRLSLNLDQLVSVEEPVMLSRLASQTGFFPEMGFLLDLEPFWTPLYFR